MWIVQLLETNYEAGKPMSGSGIVAAASDAIKYGSKAELVTDWIKED